MEANIDQNVAEQAGEAEEAQGHLETILSEEQVIGIAKALGLVRGEKGFKIEELVTAVREAEVARAAWGVWEEVIEGRLVIDVNPEGEILAADATPYLFAAAVGISLEELQAAFEGAPEGLLEALLSSVLAGEEGEVYEDES